MCVGFGTYGWDTYTNVSVPFFSCSSLGLAFLVLNSSSSGSRTSSRRRTSISSKSRSSRGLVNSSTLHYNKHNNIGPNIGPIMGVNVTPNIGICIPASVSKDYASMASSAKDPASFAVRSPSVMCPSIPGIVGPGSRGFASAQFNINASMVRPMAAVVSSGKDYASLASSIPHGLRGPTSNGSSSSSSSSSGPNGSGGPGSSGVANAGYADHNRSTRVPGKPISMTMSARHTESSRSAAGGSSNSNNPGANGSAGRFDRPGGKGPPSPTGSGRDQCVRERDWRSNLANGRRPAVSPSNSQVKSNRATLRLVPEA